MKQSSNFFQMWGGISGCQHALPLFFEAAVLEEKLPPTVVAALTAANVAKRFGLAGKGELAVGTDADMVLLSTRSAQVIRKENLLYRHAQSPYVERTSRIAVRETWARGATVWPLKDGATATFGQILRPFRP